MTAVEIASIYLASISKYLCSDIFQLCLIRLHIFEEIYFINTKPLKLLNQNKENEISYSLGDFDSPDPLKPLLTG